MTDKKKGHWGTWAETPEGEPYTSPWGLSNAKPAIHFNNLEARDAALKDLEAMAALRTRGIDTILERHGTLPEDVYWECEAIFLEGRSEATDMDDPADAILASLGEQPKPESHEFQMDNYDGDCVTCGEGIHHPAHKESLDHDLT